MCSDCSISRKIVMMEGEQEREQEREPLLQSGYGMN